MKKVKVTKKPKSAAGTDFTLVPSLVRMYVIYMVLFILAYAIGLLIRFLMDRENFTISRLTSDWVLDGLLVFAGPLLLAMVYRKRWTVKVIDRDKVEGPTGAFSERAQLPIREINWPMTLRSINSSFGMANGIYAGSQRILMNVWFFAPEKYREFLSLIGYDRAMKK